MSSNNLSKSSRLSLSKYSELYPKFRKNFLCQDEASATTADNQTIAPDEGSVVPEGESIPAEG